ncbi:metallophosphoesterase [Candidatus Saccharibacteria bacterium]|nr:metallophosphoesterase [Candidatus Saccharibacteria bacterium]
MREPLYCRTPKYVIETGKLKKPVRVALTNDWHVTSIVSDKQYKIFEKSLKNILPDLIIIQGDSFDTPEAFDDSDLVRALKKRLELCSKIAPTIMILGNHDQVEPIHSQPKDYADYLTRVRKNVVAEWRSICNETNVRLIVDSWFEIRGLRIFGFFQGPEMFYQESGKTGENYCEMKRKIKELSKEGTLKIKSEKVNWFVGHAPINELYRMRELKGFEIFSFGHTHGGCVPIGIDFIVDALGGHGGIVAPFMKFFPSRFMRGREKHKNGTNYIVNTGMVMAQGSAPKVLQCANFLKAAEVTEVVVK